MSDTSSNPGSEQQNDLRDRMDRFVSEGYLADNPPDLQNLSIIAYRLLANGNPVTFAELSEAADLPIGRIEELFRLIPDSAYETDDTGRLVGFIGLSVVPAPHTFVVAGRKFCTWCAFDALFLPEILDVTAELETFCPASKTPVNITLSPTGLLAAEPPKPVMSIVATDVDACCADLRGAFCNQVNLFRDEPTFRSWAKDKAEVDCISLDAALELAHRRNRLRYPDQQN